MTRMIPQAAAHWQAHTSSTCDMSESVATAHLSVGPTLRRAPARPGFTDYPVVISRPTPTLPMLIFVTKTLSTGANGQKAGGTSPLVAQF